MEGLKEVEDSGRVLQADGQVRLHSHLEADGAVLGEDEGQLGCWREDVLLGGGRPSSQKQPWEPREAGGLREGRRKRCEGELRRAS